MGIKIGGGKVSGPGLSACAIATLAAATIILGLLALTFTGGVTGSIAHGSPLTMTHALSRADQGGSAVVGALNAALNNHDSEAALALFSDTAVVSDLSNIACLPGPPPFCGGSNVFTTRVQIRGWLEQLNKDNIEVKEVGSFNVTGDNVTWTLEVTVNEYRRLNVAPLVASAQAVIHTGRINSLTIRLNQESTTKLALGYASNQRTPYSTLAGGISVGILALGLVFPGAAIYYTSRVKKLFATVPRLDKPWILLGAGVGSLFISVLLVALRDFAGISPNVVDPILDLILVICAFLVMAAMILMKRVMISEPDE